MGPSGSILFLALGELMDPCLLKPGLFCWVLLLCRRLLWDDEKSVVRTCLICFTPSSFFPLVLSFGTDLTRARSVVSKSSLSDSRMGSGKIGLGLQEGMLACANHTSTLVHTEIQLLYPS